MPDLTAAKLDRILVIKLSSLGDLFHALPAVHELKRHTGAAIDWVVQDPYTDLVACFDDVDEVITFPRRSFWRQVMAFRRHLRQHRYDLVVDLQGLFKSGLVAGMALSGHRLGPSFHREGSRLFYDAVVGECNRKRHAVDQNLDVIRHLGFAVGEPRFPVRFPDVATSSAGSRVALVPVSRWASKDWPVLHYAELARGLLTRTDLNVILLGGPEDMPTCREVETLLASNRVQNLAGKLSLIELGSQLQTMDLVVSNDSGPAHMAVACGTPSLVLFGPTDAGRTGPYGEAHRVIRAPEPCYPCYQRLCRERGGACMAGLLVADVLAAALEMLDKKL